MHRRVVQSELKDDRQHRHHEIKYVQGVLEVFQSRSVHEAEVPQQQNAEGGYGQIHAHAFPIFVAVVAHVCEIGEGAAAACVGTPHAVG